MKVIYRLGYTAYYSWSLHGSCLSSGVAANSLEDLKVRVEVLKDQLFKKPHRFKAIVFSQSIEVEFKDLIPVTAITEPRVRKPRR